MNKLNQSDLDMLNSKDGLYSLLRNKKVNVSKALNEVRMIEELKKN